jgi:tetratricopeptide (TPR) repeat protein
VRAARKLLAHALDVDLRDPRTLAQWYALERRYYDLTGGTETVIEPLHPSWLFYVRSQEAVERTARDVIALGHRLDADPVVQFKAGVCLLEAGEARAALAKLDQAASRMPHDELALAWRRRAAALLDPFAAGGTVDVRMLRDLGLALLEKKDYNGALRPLREWARLAPDDPHAWLTLGRACVQAGLRDGAASAFERALAAARAKGDAALVEEIERQHGNSKHEIRNPK